MCLMRAALKFAIYTLILGRGSLSEARLRFQTSPISGVRLIKCDDTLTDILVLVKKDSRRS